MEILPQKWASPSLSSERLEIRALREGDAEPLWRVRSSARVARYQTWTAFSLEDARALIASMRHRSLAASGSWYQFGIAARRSDRLIGDLALRFPAAAPGQAEIGFNIGERFWGRGYGAEAVARFAAWLEGERGIRRIFAITDERNHASRKLLRKCGFRAAPEGWRLVYFKREWAGETLYERRR